MEAETLPSPKPRGRSLAEFGRLRPAESMLLSAAAAGSVAEVAASRPDEQSDENVVRAGFIRFLALGGDDDAPVHEKGVRLRGAAISGELDLETAEVNAGLALLNCTFEKAPVLRDARIRGLLAMNGSRFPGLFADRLRCESAVYLRDGAESTSSVLLLNARIEGNLDCSGSRFETSGRGAIVADGVDVGGSVLLCRRKSMTTGFEAHGPVRLVNAHVGGDVACNGGKFRSLPGETDLAAISADGLVVDGNVTLANACNVQGAVRLLRARIGGDLVCRYGIFDNPDSIALDCEGALVTGSLIFDRVDRRCGLVSLRETRVGWLIDDRKSWSGGVVLDGFVYGRLVSAEPMTVQERIAWLDQQDSPESGRAVWTRDFRPHPWIHLRNVLRAAGDYEAAREVGIAFEAWKRRCGRIGETGELPAWWCRSKALWRVARRVYRGVAVGLHWLYGALVDYGYRPLKLVLIAVLVWAVCTGLFYVGANNRGFGPQNSAIYLKDALKPCAAPETGAPKWHHCAALPPEYPRLFPPIYSLNVMLPVVKLGQAATWAPMTGSGFGLFMQILVWFETVFGWVASLILIAVLSGLAKKDE